MIVGFYWECNCLKVAILHEMLPSPSVSPLVGRFNENIGWSIRSCKILQNRESEYLISDFTEEVFTGVIPSPPCSTMRCFKPKKVFYSLIWEECLFMQLQLLLDSSGKLWIGLTSSLSRMEVIQYSSFTDDGVHNCWDFAD